MSKLKKKNKEKDEHPIGDGRGVNTTINWQERANFRKNPLHLTLASYLKALRNLDGTANLLLPHIENWFEEETERLRSKIRPFLGSINTEEGMVAFKSVHEFVEFDLLMKNLSDLATDKSFDIFTRSLFTQIFAEFDAFSGSLLKAIYQKNDKLYKNISREISISDLVEFSDMDAVKKDILEKEIDCFRRDSYAEQFAKLERKFGISLCSFKEWGEFIELTQRRNIFIHNAGMVSEQYILSCKKVGYQPSETLTLGAELSVDVKYLKRAIHVMSKVAFMLVYTLWNKIFPEETDALHSSINDTLYKSLEGKRWEFVSDLDHFIMSKDIRLSANELFMRMETINIAIAHRFFSQPEKATNLLKSLDWSACHKDFILATCVLHGDFTKASKVMKEIGKVGELVEQKAYHFWPLFTEFRDRPEFYEAYQEIYGVAYSSKLTDGANSPLLVGATIEPTKKEGDQLRSRRKRKIEPVANKTPIIVTEGANKKNSSASSKLKKAKKHS